jgi:hypothetical protein
MIALSIRRPWPWAILHLPREVWKDVENRDWPTKFRGKFLIHASKGCTRDEYADGALSIRDAVVERLQILGQFQQTLTIPALDAMPSGAIVGWAEVVDCVERSDSPWFCGSYGFVLGRRGILEPILCRGQLGFFQVPEEVAQAVRAQAKNSPPAMPADRENKQ